jgi:transcription elongation factor Elf1
MSKAHRGTGVRTEPNHGRGKCPRCGNENIKVLYEKEIDGNTIKICKFCNAQLKNIARKEARASKAAAAAAAPATEEAPAEA